MRTLPKTIFLLRIALVALPGAALVAFAGSPLLAHAAPAKARLASREPAPKATTPAPVAAPEPDFDHNNGVAAIVNEQIVTEYDLRQRLALVTSTSGQQPTKDDIKRLRPQILEQLKTEKLELEEAQRKNITVAPAEVDKEIDGILRDNHLTLDQLKAVLDRSHVAIATLRSQISVQLAWQKAIEDEYADRINITEADVTEELARIMESANKPHYLVGEIFLAVDSPDQDDKVLKNANDLVTQMTNGAPFPTIARQFSQSPSAAEGGDIGWVSDGQLSPELTDALKKLSPGGIAPPVRSSGGYYILTLRQRQEPADAKLPDPAAAQQSTEKPGVLPLARLLILLPPKPPKEVVQNVLKAANDIRQRFTSCPQLQKMVTGIRGVMFMDLGEMKLVDLSEDIQTELAKTHPGEPTEPFMSAAGMEVIARCDKRAPPPLQQFIIPSRDQVEKRLFQEQISMLARRYIRDLRREANVETR